MDADEVLLELAAEFFEGHGHDFEAASDALTAQAHLTAGRFDAVLIDYHLPAGTGPGLIRSVLREYPGTRLVVLTGDHAPETRAQAEELGARRILDKPFRFRQLLDLLEEDRAGGKVGPALTRYERIDEGQIGQLKQALLKDPRDAEARWLLAFAFYKAGKYADASHLLKQILEDEPDNALAWYYLGAARYRFGLYEDAVAAWEEASRLAAGQPLAERLVEHIARARGLIRQA